ncbi:succinate--CoA ligase subunit alpha [Candidatus Formimonas warabiya]|uniref:Succinate--CoA ligase [ADP-forming] subunit alpha n=1 Tax=Formimonas warabiya TaxID=1761012 RepID=A0A3G1KUG0_FORW1|nr:succinate--CoA ligase subunit alpha [Candidatus Formimonas warabiya]ATW26081.1 succinate--CoA ligase subunit alpha [Candidatus Formimonas warabiya]
MAIYIDQHTQVLIQGITGRQGTFHAWQMVKYGTKVVAGVSPGKGGQKIDDIPVYNTVAEAVNDQPIDASILFVPAASAKDGAFEAMAAGVKLLVLLPEHIPIHDAMAIVNYAKCKGTTVIGPNTFGVVSSGKCKIGIPPNQYFVPGPVGVVARSGTLSYEIVGAMAAERLGTTTVVGLGGDRVVGLNFIDVLKEFQKDPETKVIVLVGEIGGTAEEEAAAYIKEHITKPVVAYLAGKSAPAGKRMGHAGAIIERGMGTFEGKVKALNAVGVDVATLSFEVPELVKKALNKKIAFGA